MSSSTIARATRAQLLALARSTAALAHCPYSGFRVGAAILTGEGEFVVGANIENASYGLTICAERTAVFKAVSAGAHSIIAVAVSCPDLPPGGLSAERMPCGACRQVIAEFGSPNMLILVDGVGEFCLCDLLPQVFAFPQRIVRSPVNRASRPRVCIDIDNVIADTDTLMREIIEECTHGRVRLRYSDVKNFDYRECVDSSGNALLRRRGGVGVDEWHEVHELFSRRVLEVHPYPGAVEAVELLSNECEVHFVTSRLLSARADTALWLAKHSFPSENRLHFVRSGEKHCTMRGFFAAVEDDLSQAIAFADAGVHSFVRVHPWNREPPSENIHHCASLGEIAEGIRKLVGLGSHEKAM